MQQINLDHIQQRLIKPTAKSARDEIVQKIAELTNRTPKSVHFQTLKFSVSRLWELYNQANKWEVNPGALLNKLLKTK